TPNVLQPDVVLVERRHFLLQVAAEQGHQEVNFTARTLPVFFREGVQREGRDVNACCRFDGRTYSRDAGTMSSDTRQVTAPRPAAIAVHDDSDVFREPLGI